MLSTVSRRQPCINVRRKATTVVLKNWLFNRCLRKVNNLFLKTTFPFPFDARLSFLSRLDCTFNVLPALCMLPLLPPGSEMTAEASVSSSIVSLTLFVVSSCFEYDTFLSLKLNEDFGQNWTTLVSTRSLTSCLHHDGMPCVFVFTIWVSLIGISLTSSNWHTKSVRCCSSNPA